MCSLGLGGLSYKQSIMKRIQIHDKKLQGEPKLAFPCEGGEDDLRYGGSGESDSLPF